MPRPIWKGTIGFGLVAVPVKLFSATEDRDVRFHELQGGTGERVRHKRVVEGSDEEVPYDDIVKGYQVSRGEHVIVEPEELEAVEASPARTATPTGSRCWSWCSARPRATTSSPRTRERNRLR
jgi:DNA end-binding protein Ku